MRDHLIEVLLTINSIIDWDAVWSHSSFLLLFCHLPFSKEIKWVYSMCGEEAKLTSIVFHNEPTKLEKVANTHMSLWSNTLNMMDVKLNALRVKSLICLF